jgi:hypothetical protein
MKDIKKVVEYIKKNRMDEYGNIDLANMDFGNANVNISGMKVGGVLCQYSQEVGGDLLQSFQMVQGFLSQHSQTAKRMYLQDREGLEQDKDGRWVKKSTLSERLSASDLSNEDKKVLSELVRSSEEGAKEAKRELPKKETKKYTLQEIYDKGFAIHCDTESKANRLLMAFDKMGWRWNTGARYTEFNNWKVNKDGTCYFPSDNSYDLIDSFKSEEHVVFEFDDVDLGEGK